MKRLFLLSVIAFALSIVSCEKGQLRDLENPQFEELENGNFNAAEEETTGILKKDIRIPTHG